MWLYFCICRNLSVYESNLVIVNYYIYKMLWIVQLIAFRCVICTRCIWHVQGLMWHGDCMMPIALLWTKALKSTVLDISYFRIIHKWLLEIISNYGWSIN